MIARQGSDRHTMLSSTRSTALALASLCLLAAPGTALAQTGTTGGSGRAAAAAPTPGSEITLAIGEQYTMPAGSIRSYSLASEGVVDVRVPSSGDRLLIVGQRAGNTSLLVIRSDGTQQTYPITVFRVAVEQVRQQVTQLLQGYNGVSINQIGGRLFLEGGVANEQQQRRVQQIAAIYPGQVESLVSVDPTIVERRINVRVDLYFVELSRNASYVFGIGWPTSFGPTQSDRVQANITYGPGMQGGANMLQAGLTALVTVPLPRVDIGAQAGWARVHRQATLVTANGNEATYHSGGELNYQISNGLAMDIRRIDYGSTISLTPRFDPSTSRVDIRLQADLSDLVETGTPLPGRTISRVNTLVNLQLGQSIMLSGIRSRATTAGSNGIALLSQIPIIGALFGTQTRRDRENEMVVFVVPSVIEGMSRQSEDRVAAALRAYEDFSGNVQDNALVPRQSATAPAGSASTP
jgi:pilus assembly protein CpaC